MRRGGAPSEDEVNLMRIFSRIGNDQESPEALNEKIEVASEIISPLRACSCSFCFSLMLNFEIENQLFLLPRNE